MELLLSVVFGKSKDTQGFPGQFSFYPRDYSSLY